MLTTEWGPVGTRGGCGAGWGPGACPGGNALQWGLRGANKSPPNEDKHKAPSSTPPFVPTGPWAASTSMDRITRFGRQNSSGKHREQDAGDHQGPPRHSSPPSPLRVLMSFLLGGCVLAPIYRPLPAVPLSHLIW